MSDAVIKKLITKTRCVCVCVKTIVESVYTHLFVRGPTKGLVNSWMKALEANIIPTSTFSWMSSLCLAMYLNSYSASPDYGNEHFIICVQGRDVDVCPVVD